MTMEPARRARAAARRACFFLWALGVFVPSSPAQSDCAGISPVSHTTLTKVNIATGVPGQLLFLTTPPGDPNRRFIVDQTGRIYLHKRGAAPSASTLVLDIRDRVTSTSNEQGLIGMAFDPDFSLTGEFYVDYTEPAGLGGSNTIVARYSMDTVDPDLADPSSEQRILRIAQPAFGFNHNGGWIGFGPDGYLYIATGDGGGGGDQHGTCGNGQNIATLLGKLLRIDVRGVAPNPVAPECDTVIGNYMVPGDNPFAGAAGCDEIWSYGLRNPWRNSFDRGTGDLYVADVGQGCWEEMNWTASGAGENFGWRQMEGSHCFQSGGTCDPPNQPCAGSPDCGDPSLVLPVMEYKNFQGHPDGEGCSVTGGYVYRGCRMPNLRGTYFYGDYCDGFVRSFEVQAGTAVNPLDWKAELGVATADNLTSFGEDDEGEIFIVERTGTVSKVLPPLTDFQVSAPGADPFRLHRDADWTWEDLAFTSEHRLAGYKIYRGQPGGLFQCVHQSPAPSWAGDPETPVSGGLFAYLVTAVNSAGGETHSGDPDRSLDPAFCL